MESRSMTSRRAIVEVLGTLAVGVAGWLLSRFLRSEFPAPSGNTWLWICAAVAWAVCYWIAVKRGLTPLSWMVQFMIAYLSLQILLQVGFSYGVISF